MDVELCGRAGCWSPQQPQTRWRCESHPGAIQEEGLQAGTAAGSITQAGAGSSRQKEMLMSNFWKLFRRNFLRECYPVRVNVKSSLGNFTLAYLKHQLCALPLSMCQLSWVTNLLPELTEISISEQKNPKGLAIIGRIFSFWTKLLRFYHPNILHFTFVINVVIFTLLLYYEHIFSKIF